MQLTVTEPIFLWLLGIVAVLGIIILLLVSVALGYVIALLRLGSRKAEDIAGTIDTVRTSVEATTETFNHARDQVADFSRLALSAAGLAKLVRTFRAETETKPVRDDLSDAFGDIELGRAKKKSSRKE